MFRPHWLTAVDEPGARPYERRWLALVVLCTAVLVGQVDTTIVNVALTSIGEDLGATTSDLQWTMDAYAVTLAGLVLAGGGVADRFGRRRVFMIGLVVFAVGSIAAVFATEPWHLIASRAVMGLGSALFFPPALSLLAVLFPKEERARAVAIWALIGGLGTALGPVVGGVLLDSFWWGSVFVVNLPIAVAAFVGAAILLPESTRPDADALDRTGALLSIIGLAALVFGLIEGPGRGWTDPSIVIALALGIGALVGFARYELRHPAPMVHVDVFRHRAVSGGALVIVAGGICMFGMFFLVPQMLENVRGDSTIVTGLLLAPFGITFIPLALVADRLVTKFGIARLLVAGTLVTGAGVAVLARVGRVDANLPVVLGVLLVGAGLALSVPPATTAIINALPSDQAGDGSAVNQFTRQVAGALGVAIAGSVLATVYRDDVDDALSGLPADQVSAAEASVTAGQQVASSASSGSADLVQAVNRAFDSGYRVSMFVLAGMMVAVAIVVGALMRGVADEPKPADSPAGDPPA